MSRLNILIASAMSCALITPVWATEAPAAAPSPEELKTMLYQHDEALNRQDLKAVMSFFADDPAVVMMGTGPGEFWKGKAAIESVYQELFKDFKAGSLKHECPDASGGHHGEVAWLIAACNMQETAPNDKVREYKLNVSAVLKKEKTGWKFQSMHFSNLTDDCVPPPEGAAPTATPATGAPKSQ